MSIRVSPIECVLEELDVLFGSDRERGEVLEEVARLEVRLPMQPLSRLKCASFWAGRAAPMVSGHGRAGAMAVARPP